VTIKLTNVAIGLDQNPESGGQSRHVVRVVEGKGQDLETDGDGIGAEGEIGLGTSIEVEKAGARRAEEVAENRKGHGHQLPTKG